MRNDEKTTEIKYKTDLKLDNLRFHAFTQTVWEVFISVGIGWLVMRTFFYVAGIY